jgi:HPr kinase/phosphorylase
MTDHMAPEPITRWVTGQDDTALWLNATAIALEGQGLLLLGAPGAGKSSLALSLMALGAGLISDDGVRLRITDRPMLERPAQSPDLIEARGVGLLHGGPVVPAAPLSLVVDLDRPEPARLPPRRLVAIGDLTCPLILGRGHPTLAAILVILVRHGRAEP